MYDSGSGQLFLESFGGSDVKPFFIDSCPFHVQLKAYSSVLKISEIKLKLSGKL